MVQALESLVAPSVAGIRGQLVIGVRAYVQDLNQSVTEFLASDR